MRVGVFNNRRAGGGGAQHGESATDVAQWLRTRNDVAHVEPDAGTIAEGLAELARREVEVLVVNGGDGTLQRILTILCTDSPFERMPLVAPLRSGRTNTVASDIGSRRNGVRALEALLDAAADGSIERRIVEKPVMRIELAGEMPPQFGLFCGFGVIHRAIELTHRMFPPGRAQGVFGSTVVTAMLALRLATGRTNDVLISDRMDIRVDGAMLPDHLFKVVIATSMQRFFAGLRPFWGTEDGSVRFTAIAEGALGLGRLLSAIRGRKPRGADTDTRLCSRNAHDVELAIECGLTIDGEMYTPRPGRTVHLDADRRVRFVRSDT